MECPNCGLNNPPEMKFCGRCGTQLKQVCPGCGFANPTDYGYCGQCGIRLPEPVEGVPPVPPQPTPPPEADISPGPEVEPALLEGERRTATVILADVTGSTDLLERIGTEGWVEIMNRVLQILGAEVYRFGGEVDQFRGDGLVAFFGTRAAHEDDPERAVLAGLGMQEAIKPYAADLADREGINLRLRVGVNTGEVIVASIGDSRQHSEDTAMGQAIAIAARMETAAEPGTVLVSESTYRLVEGEFEWESLAKIPIKGVSEPIAVYRPLAPQADAPAGRPYGLSVPLIGREDELRSLKGCIQDLRNGRGGIVMVTGEKGMGKSLLMSELAQHVIREGALLGELYGRDTSQSASPTWLRARCRSYDQSLPYSMWLDLLRGWLGVRADEPPAETRDRLHHETEALWGDSVAEHYAYLATLLSLPLEEESAERIKSLDAEGLRQRFFFTLWSWVKAMSGRGPLVLAFSDVHWADSTSLDLLRHCLPLCDHQELLWLIVFRADRTSPVWEFRHRVETEYPHRVTSLSLPPLTEGQSNEMIDQLIGAGTLPAETRALILDKAQGNPYYMAELVYSLIAQGVLARDTNGWRATRAIASLDLPDSLQSLLLARIDSLSAGERRVLQMAAVIGSVFWFKVLEGLAADVPDLRRHLTSLQRAELIYERGRLPDLGMEYVFKSSLMRDAAYEGTLSAQRVTRHRQVAEQLERLLGPETLTQYAGALAFHYHRAEESKKELFYTLQAADHARGIYANAEALEHYTDALELLDRIEVEAADEDQLYAIRTQRFEVLDRRRDMFYMRGDAEAGRSDAQALLPLARQLEDDPSWMIDALLQQPSVGHWRSREELEAGVPMAQQALALARQLGDRRREMQSLAAIGSLGLYLHDPDVWEHAEQALELARQLGDQRFELRLLIGMGQVYAWSDQPERGVKYLEAALPLSQALGDKMSEMALLDLIGLQFERSGDYHRLLTDYHQKRLTISREIGHRPIEGDALMHCGQIQSLRLGDYEAGLALLEECLRIWEGFPAELFPLLRVAQIKSAQGRYDEALGTLEHAHRIEGVQAIHDMGSAGMRLVSAIVYNGLGEKAHLHQALELASQTRQLVADNPLLFRQYEMAAACESAAAHLALAEFPADQVERQTHLCQALESSQAALDLYQSFGYVQIAECVSEEILYRHSLTLAANGRQAEAGQFLQRAHDEMMRKHELIPADSPFRRTYLEEIPLHRDIRAALAASESGSLGEAPCQEDAQP